MVDGPFRSRLPLVWSGVVSFASPALADFRQACRSASGPYAIAIATLWTSLKGATDVLSIEWLIFERFECLLSGERDITVNFELAIGKAMQ